MLWHKQAAGISVLDDTRIVYRFRVTPKLPDLARQSALQVSTGWPAAKLVFYASCVAAMMWGSNCTR